MPAGRHGGLSACFVFAPQLTFYAYAADRQIATYFGGHPIFNHTDWVGTIRRATALDGSIYQNSINASPWGEENYNPNSLGDASLLHFTGKERDEEDDLIYFGARFYDPNQPRFMTADWADKPEAVPYSDLADPQSLNLYTYVRNNPVSRTDRDGHCCDVSISDIIQFGVGVIQGAVSAFSQGGVAAAQPSSGDTGAQRLGQAVGANGVGLYGAGQIVDGGAAVGAAVTACGGSGGAACGVAAPVGVVGATQVATGSAMVVGAVKADVAIATTPLNSSDKPDTRAKNTEKNTLEGAQDQADSISHAQDKLKKSGQGEKIQSTTKSQQRLKNAIKKIKSSQDLDENGH